MNLDLNDLRSAVTLLSFIAFVGVMVWAWQAKRRAAFDAAARLPFSGDIVEEGERDE